MKKITYLTVQKPFVHEIPKIKGSRFITTLIPIPSEEEKDSNLHAIQKHHHNATHNCYARRLGIKAQKNLFGERSIYPSSEFSSDDGEPANTAGKPLLKVLSGKKVFETLIVVTRYFWGTLLGIGGLIQAYTEAAQSALSKAPYLEKEVTKNLILYPTYEQLATVHHLFSKYEATLLNEQYEPKLTQKIWINIAFEEPFLNELQDQQISFQEN